MITTTFGQLSENEIAPIRIRWKETKGKEKPKMSTDEVIGPDRAVGFIGSGLFNLKEDEALVMTLNMLGTEYISLNTYRPFLVSPEHVYGSSSLNNFQASQIPMVLTLLSSRVKTQACTIGLTCKEFHTVISQCVGNR